jgi:hypothetical protein
MGSSNLGGPEILVRLGFDPTKFAEGIEQAKSKLANFKGQAVLIETQLKIESLKQRTEFTAANRAATQQRIADLNSELQSAIGSLARKSAAEKSALMEHVQALRQQREAEVANLSAFDQQIAKVNQLRAAYLQASSAAKQSQAAVGIFSQMSGAPSMIGVLQAQLAQMSGIVPGLARLSQLLVGVSFSSGEAEASIVGMTGVLMRFGGPVIAVAAGLAGVTFAAAKAALSVGEWAHGLEQTAQRTGLSVEKLQQLEFIGKATGFTLDNLVKINRTLAIAIVEGNPAFDMLGVKTRTANGQLREEYDVLLDLADAFQKMPEGVAKIAVATELSSRFGQAMIPTLNLGSQGIRELSAEAEKFAPKIKELAEAHAKWDIANAKLSASITLLKGDLAGMMPVLTAAADKLAEFLRAAEKSGAMKLPLVPAILATPALAGAELVLERYAPKPAPKAPTPPAMPSSLQVPGGIPPFEGIAVTLARKQLIDAEAAAKLKSLSIDQQMVEVQKQLNALKAGEATDSETEKVKNIKEEIRLTSELATLGKEKAKAEEEYAKKLDEVQGKIRGEIAMQQEAAAKQRIAETVGHPLPLAPPPSTTPSVLAPLPPAQIPTPGPLAPMFPEATLPSETRAPVPQPVLLTPLPLAPLSPVPQPVLLKPLPLGPLPSAPLQLVPPSSAPPLSIQVPENIPPAEDIAVKNARKELAGILFAEKFKELAIDQQILEVQKQLNALRAGGAGDSETENNKKLQEQEHLTGQLIALGRERIKVEEELANKSGVARIKLAEKVSAQGAGQAPAVPQLPVPPSLQPFMETQIGDVQEKLNTLLKQEINLRASLANAPSDLVIQKALNENQIAKLDLIKQEGLLRAQNIEAQKKSLQDDLATLTAINNALNEAGLKDLALDQSLHMIAGRTGLGEPRKPPAGPPGAQQILPFEGQLTDIQASRAVGLTSAQQEIDSLKALAGPLGDEIKLREANLAGMDQELDGYKAQRDELQKMIELLAKIKTASTEAGKQTPMAQMFGTLKEFGDIVGKFSSSFGKEFQHMFAATEAIQKSFKSLQELGGTRIGGILQPTNFATIMRNIFITQPSDPNVLLGQKGAPPIDKTKSAAAMIDMAGIGVSMVGQFQNALGGPGGLKGAINSALGMGMSGAMLGFEASGGNPIGAAVGGGIGLVAGGITGLFGSGKAQKKATDQANAISLAVQKITDSLNLGATDIKTAISQIQAQQKIANNISGKGTKATKLQLQQQLDQQLNQLQAQQKQTLDKFHAALGILQLPEGAQGTAQSIQQIAAALKEAAGAGATAAEQLQFYNLSVQALTTTLGRTLRTDEQGTLDALRQEITLREQRADILKSAADQELAIRQSLGVQRVLTPGQQAAKQIKDIETAKNKQLAALDEQQATLDAQINGQAELYGWSLKDLDIAGAKAKLIAEQLSLTQQITAETIAQIKAQQDYYATILSGKLPTLPVGTLPSGFTFPTGGTAPTGVGGVTMTVGTINVTLPQFPPLPGPPARGGPGVFSPLPTPEQIADSFQKAIAIINTRRYAGLE